VVRPERILFSLRAESTQALKIEQLLCNWLKIQDDLSTSLIVCGLALGLNLLVN
jgi:hypothetical protein